jgi:hypothetical protein
MRKMHRRDVFGRAMTMSTGFSSTRGSALNNPGRSERDHAATPPLAGDPTRATSRYLLWVDGVGAFQLFTGNRVTIGGPTRDQAAADLVLLANLSRKHATVIRSDDGYVLEAHAACKVADRPVEERTHLNTNYPLELASGVRLRFRIPSVLSATAVIDFVSDHRPARTIDGVILMDETCLLGATRDNHVVCPAWNETVLIHRKPDGFWCKSQAPISFDGRVMPGGGPVKPGTYISGSDFGFRLETCP